MSEYDKEKSLRRKKLDLLTKIYDNFLNNSSNEITHRIVAKLIKAKCLRFSLKNTIIDSNLQIRDRADKLFDYVYKSDVNVIDVFLCEIKEVFPHIYRIIENQNKEINSAHLIDYFVGTTQNEIKQEILNRMIKSSFFFKIHS
jgi:hypothetical protein